MWVSGLALCPGIDGEQLALGETGRVKQQPVPVNWPGAGGVLRPLGDAPKFLSGLRLIRVAGHRSDADQLRLAAVPDDERCRVALAHVSVAKWFTVRAEVLKIHAALGAPDGLAGALVERGHVLQVGPVKGEDQQVAVNDW